jgi:hypothetical protein
MGFREQTRHPESSARRHLCIALTGSLAACMSACRAGDNTAKVQGQRMDTDKKEVVYFDVNLKSYLDRPIFDVYLNGRDIGVAGGHPHGGPGGLMTGVPVPLGLQIVTWRLGGPEGMLGNGDTVKASNQPVLLRPDVKLGYLGVHIYPDNTVELIPDSFWPEASKRGEEINRQWEKKNGK